MRWPMVPSQTRAQIDARTHHLSTLADAAAAAVDDYHEHGVAFSESIVRMQAALAALENARANPLVIS